MADEYYVGMANDWTVGRVSRVLTYGLASLLSISLLYFIFAFPFARARYATLFLGGVILLLAILNISEIWQREERSLIDRANLVIFAVYGVAGSLAAAYIFVEFNALQTDRIANYLFLDLVAGVVLIWIVVDLTWREYGNIIAGVIVLSLLYAATGFQFLGVFGHSGLSWTRFIAALSIEFSGVLGSIFQLVSVWIFVFLIYAGLLYKMGIIDMFLDLGKYLAQRSLRAIPMVAIVSSMLMGSIMGSAIANTVVTGSVTIPLMKEHGLEARTAAAIEAVASTGGQVLPPIMSVVAFIMAQRLPMSYADIVIAGTLPALIYFGVIAFSAHLYCREEMALVEVPNRFEFANSKLENFRLAIPFFLSILGLLYALIIRQYTPSLGGLFTIVTFLGTYSLMRIITVPSRDTVIELIENTVKGSIDGTVTLAPLAVLIAGLEIVISVMGITGLPNKFAQQMLLIDGLNLLTLAVLVMIVSIVFGLGMPTVPAYLFTAALSVPLLTRFGVDPLVSHFFVFYFAVFSNVTPPIAIASAMAAQIANAEFIRTALRAFVMASPAFLIPYVFLYNNQLLILRFPESLITFAISMVGLVTLVYLIQRLPEIYSKIASEAVK